MRQVHHAAEKLFVDYAVGRVTRISARWVENPTGATKHDPRSYLVAPSGTAAPKALCGTGARLILHLS
jgi:hypothetical protein